MKKLMKISISVFVFIISVTLLFGQGISRADTILFQDNFNAENGGYAALNYSGFNNWNVTDGSVDLIGNDSWDFHPGNGLYVDLDGSTSNAGVLTTKASFTYLFNKWYRLDFDLGRSQPYNGDNEVTVIVSFVNTSYTIYDIEPLTSYSIKFFDDGTSGPAIVGAISFSNAGGDNIGAVLDNVTLTQVPEPTTLLLLGLGLIGLAGMRRKF